MFSGMPSDITSRGIDFLSLIGDNLEEEKRQKEEEMKTMFAVRRQSTVQEEGLVNEYLRISTSTFINVEITHTHTHMCIVIVLTIIALFHVLKH